MTSNRAGAIRAGAAAVMAAAAVVFVAAAGFAGAARAQEKVQGPGTEADAQAIRQVFAEWYEAFSRHDARAASMAFAEDADFTNMAGAHDRGRKEIETHLARIFAGNLKAAKRTDMVKSIRFFSPELAEVDADTVITGTLRADGSEGPPRKGLMVTTMTKRNGRWLISVFHEVEFPPAAAAPAR
jgi:uncharacterized protein (TIGR02246 family)